MPDWFKVETPRSRDEFRLLENQPDQQLIFLEAEFQKAVRLGIIKSMPAREDEFRADEFGKNNVKALRDRLYRLGYLAKDAGQDYIIDDKLRQAIRAFQKDTSVLTVDGWVGAQTWQALQELFAFEPITVLKTWLKDGKITPALYRAANLRLYTYGLHGSRKIAYRKINKKGLEKWISILNILGCPLNKLNGGYDELELLDWLFDFEKLSRHISAYHKRFMDMGNVKSGQDKLFINFLQCYIKVELWLLGYDGIVPDGKASGFQKMVSRTIAGRSMPKMVPTDLYKTVETFLMDQASEEDKEDLKLDITFRDKTRKIIIRTLTELDTVNRPESLDREEERERKQHARKLIESMKNLEQSKQIDLKNEWEKMDLGARIWYGLKRAWRFLTGLIKKAAKWVIEKAKLVIRAAYHAVSEAFTLVHRSFRLFADAVDLFLSTEIRISNEHIAMSRDRDFDFRVFINSGASGSILLRFFEMLHKRLEKFHTVVGIMKTLMRLAFVAALTPTGPWGWAFLIHSLINLYGDYREKDAFILRQPMLTGI